MRTLRVVFGVSVLIMLVLASVGIGAAMLFVPIAAVWGEPIGDLRIGDIVVGLISMTFSIPVGFGGVVGSVALGVWLVGNDDLSTLKHPR